MPIRTGVGSVGVDVVGGRLIEGGSIGVRKEGGVVGCARWHVRKSLHTLLGEYRQRHARSCRKFWARDAKVELRDEQGIGGDVAAFGVRVSEL